MSRVYVADLLQRYQLKQRKSIYDRVNFLKERGWIGDLLKEEDTNKSYASDRQLQLLDEIDNFIKDGNRLKDFLIPSTVYTLKQTMEQPVESSLDSSSQEQDSYLLLIALRAIVAKMPDNSLDRYRQLEEAVEKEWILPTQLVKNLIGVNPHDGKNGYFQRGNFVFVKAGKIGRATGWLVKKIPQSDSDRQKQNQFVHPQAQFHSDSLLTN